MKTTLILTIFLLSLKQFSFGQTAELMTKSNSKLIDNDLLSIAVDKEGNQWIGTSKYGLVKLSNGVFENLTPENSIIKGDYISPIFSDSKGNIWVSYSNPNDGIAKFDGKKWTSYSKKELPVSEISIITIKEDKNGNIYFGGSEGVLIFDGKKWTKLSLPKGKYVIRTMDINSNGDIAIGHNSGLLLRKNEKWTSLTGENSELRLNTVRGVKFVDKNSLIVGYGGGFGDGGFSIIKDKKWTHYNKTNSNIPDHMVRDIEVDPNGVIWMATNNGVIKLDNGKITPILFRDGMFMNVITDIAIAQDVIWITTNFGLIKMK